MLITLARKPLSNGVSVAQTCLAHGVGALNIDGCRIQAGTNAPSRIVAASQLALKGSTDGSLRQEFLYDGSKGRWPANVLHDGSDAVLAGFPHTTSGVGGIRKEYKLGVVYGAESRPSGSPIMAYGDTGLTARFFKQVRRPSQAPSQDNKDTP